MLYRIESVLIILFDVNPTKYWKKNAIATTFFFYLKYNDLSYYWNKYFDGLCLRPKID